tara:strand:+ start:857 stop:1612 length:756 start_codon:yes stop_codon:yes gene_type:complete
LPEGAEVKRIGENLSKMVGLRKIIAVVPLSGRYAKKPIVGAEAALNGNVIGVGVKGKMIFWIMDNDRFLINTLGMTGSWSGTYSTHARVRFDFDQGPPVFFVDTRGFGTLKFIYGQNVFKHKLDSLGPDMLTNPPTYEEFEVRLDTKPYWPICKALLDQGVISGVGNYVKAESLYRARIYPKAPVSSLSSAELRKLHAEIKMVLQEAYTKGTDRNFFQAYGKKTDILGNPVVKEDCGDGRTTHWVPALQGP